MLHWIKPAAVAYAVPHDAVALPWGRAAVEPTPRALHARFLAHAATRRRAAADSASKSQRMDALYWKTCAPSALDKARGLRALGLPALP